MSDDTEYQKALDALSSLISGKQRSDGRNWAHAFDMMKVYLERVGLEDELSELSVIHVAGTKGKGSTAALVESILRQCGYKTGLYTSPHLIDVRERIRINGVPVERETFLRNMWWCLNSLKAKCDEEAGMPAYFRFLTLLGFKVFLEEKVDVVVLEVGIGGRLDATNCVRQPVVCGVTPLGFDHMELLGSTLPCGGRRWYYGSIAGMCDAERLGNTLPEIAREKAGIFKQGCPAYTVAQPADALEALRQKAEAIGAPLAVVPGWNSYRPEDPGQPLRLGLAGEHQKVNASLALTLAATWEARSPVAAAKHGQRAQQRAQQLLQDGVVGRDYAAGLEAARWPGRAQIVHEAAVEDFSASNPQPAVDTAAVSQANGASRPVMANGITSATSSSTLHQGKTTRQHHLPRLSFYLDGAHTAESMATCAHWFADEVGREAEEEGASTGEEGSAAAGALGVAPGATVGSPALGGVVVQRVLLFNCMQEREPHSLLQPLAQTLAERRVGFHHALFVPPNSTYSKVGPAAEAAGGPDLSWQQSLRGVWEAQAAAAVGGAARKQAGRPLPPISLPPLPCIPSLSLQDTARGAVLPNLQATLEWLRRCVRETPSLRMQVLVTGSLYLVGDMLKLLGKSC
ncbi:hypothetical protein N2152v2_010170 [Parachlorella kessleri]